MTLPKIKQVRAWFTGGATAEKGAGGGDYQSLYHSCSGETTEGVYR